MTKRELKVGDLVKIAHGFSRFRGSEIGVVGRIEGFSEDGRAIIKVDAGYRFGQVSGLDLIEPREGSDPVPDPTLNDENSIGREADEEPRITFTFDDQEFYVGQRVWNAIDSHLASKGDALEVAGSTTVNGRIMLAVRKVESSSLFRTDIKSISTTPPAPHEWKRGDWARHDKEGRCFVLELRREYVVVYSFDSGVAKEFLPSELTFITHTEIPE